MPTKRAKSLIKYADEFGFKVERINKHVRVSEESWQNRPLTRSFVLFC